MQTNKSKLSGKVTQSRPFRAYLATSFLGAFNDNFFKLLVTCFALAVLGEQAQRNYVPLAGGVFVLPFLVCSGYAGYLSDRFSKRRVIIWSKWLELAVMGVGLILFARGAVYGLLWVLFLMGAQSALYSPAKYGYLPETLPEEEMSVGNGMTQLCTFIAIIAGTWAGSGIASPDRFWIGGLGCVAVAGLGVCTAYFTGKTREGSPAARFQLDPFRSHYQTFRAIQGKRILVLSLLGNTYFWFVAALYQNTVPLLVKQELGMGGREIGWLLGAVGLGIGVGCAVCGRLSRGRIEFGLVLPGGACMAAVCILAGLTSASLVMAVLCSFLLGFFAGIYQLPLSTSLQKNSPEKIRGSCLALGNAVDCVSMLLAYVVQWLLLRPLGLQPSQAFIVTGVITVIVLVAMVRKVPGLLQATKELL